MTLRTIQIFNISSKGQAKARDGFLSGNLNTFGGDQWSHLHLLQCVFGGWCFAALFLRFCAPVRVHLYRHSVAV